MSLPIFGARTASRTEELQDLSEMRLLCCSCFKHKEWLCAVVNFPLSALAGRSRVNQPNHLQLSAVNGVVVITTSRSYVLSACAVFL